MSSAVSLERQSFSLLLLRSWDLMPHMLFAPDMAYKDLATYMGHEVVIERLRERPNLIFPSWLLLTCCS